MDHSISQTICKIFLFRPFSVLLFRYWYWFSGWWRYELEDAGDVGANASVQILTNVIGAIQPSNGVISAVSSARIFDALDIFFEGWHQRDTLSLKVSVNLKRMLGSLMARSNDVLINVHVLTDEDSKSWVEETILNVIGRHLTEGVVFGFENNNVTLQRRYLGGKVYQEMLLFI